MDEDDSVGVIWVEPVFDIWIELIVLPQIGRAHV